MWPGLTPAAVWDLSYQDWLIFAIASDDWLDARKKQAAAARGPGRR